MSRDDYEILVRDQLTELTDDAIAALRQAGGLWVRGRMLVMLGEADGLEDPTTRLTRPLGAPVIVPLTAAALRNQLDVAARWVKEKGRGKEKVRVPALPPAWAAEQILARTAWPFPPLAGVVATPVLRPDGSVLDRPGYDATTGLIYAPIDTFPPVPDWPGRPEATTALHTLLEPVSQFPFTDGASRAGYVAAVLSLIGRYALPGCVPGFAITAPTGGTGKGLLARVISTIGTGRPAALMGPARDDDELRKRLLAIALAGTPVVQLDNLSGVLGSDVLAAALTTETWSDRLLGVSSIVEVPLATVWLFTGNNLAFKRTLGRRIIPLSLDAKVEHPEDRDGFAIADLPGHVEAHRPALVAAALTLLRAYSVAGRPRHGAAPMGSFEAWDTLIRGAVVWAGLADPAATGDPTQGRGKIRATLDDDIAGLAALLTALADTFGERTFLAADVCERAKVDARLHTALEEAGATTRSGQVTARMIGYLFRAAESRIVDGRKLLTEGLHTKTGRRWRVMMMMGDDHYTHPGMNDGGTRDGVGLETSSPIITSSPSDDDGLPF